jgi:hypothetical protein
VDPCYDHGPSSVVVGLACVCQDGRMEGHVITVVNTAFSPSLPTGFSRPFQRETIESGDSQAIHRFLRRFAIFLTSGALAGVGGGGRLAELAADWLSPVYR